MQKSILVLYFGSSNEHIKEGFVTSKSYLPLQTLKILTVLKNIQPL